MSLYHQIKVLYPNILDKDFCIQNDGNGEFIKQWESLYPKPAQVELEAVYPQVLREQKKGI